MKSPPPQSANFGTDCTENVESPLNEPGNYITDVQSSSLALEYTKTQNRAISENPFCTTSTAGSPIPSPSARRFNNHMTNVDESDFHNPNLVEHSNAQSHKKMAEINVHNKQSPQFSMKVQWKHPDSLPRKPDDIFCKFFPKKMGSKNSLVQMYANFKNPVSSDAK